MRNTTARSSSRRIARPLAGTLAFGLLAGALATATPATAVVLDTDRPRLTEPGHDFGLHWTINAPRNGGHLDWDLTNGVTTPTLTGYHYLTNQEDGRIRVEYYNDSHVLLGSRDTAVHSAPGNGKTQWWVEIDSFSSTTVTHAHVMLQEQNANGTFTTLETEFEDFD